MTEERTDKTYMNFRASPYLTAKLREIEAQTGETRTAIIERCIIQGLNNEALLLEIKKMIAEVKKD